MVNLIQKVVIKWFTDKVAKNKETRFIIIPTTRLVCVCVCERESKGHKQHKETRFYH